MPNSETCRAVIAEVCTRVQADSAGLAEVGRFAQALAPLEAVVAQLPTERAVFEPKAAELRARWAEKLAASGAESEKAGRKHEALLFYAKAARLVGAPHDQKRDALRADFLKNRRYAVQASVDPRDRSAAALVEGLRSVAFPPGVELIAGNDQRARADARLRLALSPTKFQQRRDSRLETATYQSGVRSVENPFYRTKLDRVTQQERQVVEAENEVTRLESDVSRYQADVVREGQTPNVTTGAEQNLMNARSRLESARRHVIDERNELQRAREELSREPPLKDEPVYSQLAYTVTRHSVFGESALEATIEHQDKRQPLRFADRLAVNASDDEHAEQPVAGVPGDPLVLPPPDSLVAEIQRQAVQRLAAAVFESFGGHRETLLVAASAASGAERADLLARYVLSDPSSVNEAALADLVGLSGIPDALEVLASN
jgi:hypothetical protein